MSVPFLVTEVKSSIPCFALRTDNGYPYYLPDANKVSLPIDIPTAHPVLKRQNGNRRDELEELPPTIHADRGSDYDYDDLSYYTMFREKLEELKLGWPLTDTDEDEIEKKIKETSPNKRDFDTQLIQNAYARADPEQQSVMRSFADKMKYIL